MASAKEIRLALSQAVRPIWGTKEAFELRDRMSSELKEYAKCLYEAARSSKPITQAYEECAKEHNIRSRLKSIWRGG